MTNNKKLEELAYAYCRPRLNFQTSVDAYLAGYLQAQKEAEGLLKFVKSFDQYFAERIIDPCGYDPEKESKEDLIKLVKTLSEDNKLNLTNLRCWISKYESGGK